MMVAAEAMQKNNRRAGADPLVVEREFPNLESARGDSIFHVAALVARKSLLNSLILSAALAPQTMIARTLQQARLGASIALRSNEMDGKNPGRLGQAGLTLSRL